MDFPDEQAEPISVCTSNVGKRHEIVSEMIDSLASSAISQFKHVDWPYEILSVILRKFPDFRPWLSLRRPLRAFFFVLRGIPDVQH